MIVYKKAKKTWFANQISKKKVQLGVKECLKTAFLLIKTKFTSNVNGFLKEKIKEIEVKRLPQKKS